MELGLDEQIELLPSNAHPVNRDQEIIAINPLGKVPTFFTDAGEALYDSRVICEYLNSIAHGSLFPSESERWGTLTLQSLGDGILDAALLARYEDVARPESFKWPEWRAAQLDKVETSLAMLNANPNKIEGRVDIGTIAIGCALWYLDLRFPDLGWRDRYPEVANWYEKYSERPSMKKAWSLEA